MRAALNNPLIVGILCVLAVGLMARNFQDRFVEDAEEPSLQRRPTPVRPVSEPLDRPQGTPDSSPANFVPEAVQWVAHPRRDPFAVVAVVRREPRRPATESSRVVRSDRAANPPIPFQLKAVALEEHRKIAVLDRTILHEGETFKGYRLTRILEDGVWLMGPHGQEFLRFRSMEGNVQTGSS